MSGVNAKYRPKNVGSGDELKKHAGRNRFKIALGEIGL